MRALLAELGIDLQRRGETLSVAEFVAISNTWRPCAGKPVARYRSKLALGYLTNVIFRGLPWLPSSSLGTTSGPPSPSLAKTEPWMPHMNRHHL